MLHVVALEYTHIIVADAIRLHSRQIPHSTGLCVAQFIELCFNASTQTCEKNMIEYTAYLGLGGNLGDRLSTLRQARQKLEETPTVKVDKTSFLYLTAPVGGPPDQPDYINGVLEIKTTLEPGELLHLCQSIEADFDRQRFVPWGARTLDIDILLYADRVISTNNLQVPHPRLPERGFVLQPLCDLAPYSIHPQRKQTFASLLIKISPLQGVHRLNEVW